MADNLNEVSPPGFEGTVRAMKKHPELSKGKTKDGKDKNPYALAWHLKKKGAKAHYKDKSGEPEKKEKYKDEDKPQKKVKKGKMIEHQDEWLDSVRRQMSGEQDNRDVYRHYKEAVASRNSQLNEWHAKAAQRHVEFARENAMRKIMSHMETMVNTAIHVASEKFDVEMHNKLRSDPNAHPENNDTMAIHDMRQRILKQVIEDGLFDDLRNYLDEAEAGLRKDLK